MRIITKEQLAALRSLYPAGTRVELLQMDDVQAPPIGTKGTVIGVDDTGSLIVNWDNGSGLSVIYGIVTYISINSLLLQAFRVIYVHTKNF